MIDRKLHAAYAACAAITRNEAKNFYFAFITLPKRKRYAIYAIYTFCRAADAIADGIANGIVSGIVSGNTTTIESTLSEKIAALTRLRARLTAAAAGKPQRLTDRALSDTIVRFAVDPHDLARVIDGMEMDLTVSRYATFADLRYYCHLVAGTVGFSVLPILAHCRGRPLSQEARKFGDALGLGLQLANIVRDIAEDIARDRIYLPQEDLVRFGVTEKMLRNGEMNKEVHALLSFEIERAWQYMTEGGSLLDHLPRHARSCPMLLISLYSRILDRIEARGCDVFSSRILLSTSEKLILMLRTWIRALLR